jgi:hypothetical protein
MSKQTALDYLIDNLPIDTFTMFQDLNEVRKVIKKAKKMHKDQITDAFDEGLTEGVYRMAHEKQRLTEKQYYKQTYGVKE